MSTTLNDPKKVKQARSLIIALSVVIPVVVAVLFKVQIDGVDLTFLPKIYAGINGLTAIVLIMALVAIKSKNMNLHRNLIRVALLLSLLFLAAYVAYHATSSPTEYKGGVPGIYYTLLISHIVLSVAVIPMVLFTYLAAWEGRFDAHKKWTRFSFPIWLYVAVSGVVVYFMISPFYV
jgi:putative membrane protein